ncbi:hypothetical protein D187_002817 [Cystobacter fuscus DSM 2262]|uniref:Uncharacterized protein n=1 Tax=Cystobacter fuscus (strain ATCC 25194 / DSM 2262 / NBRC 100088 / M29) TaxID=1242864 RepID=S9PAM4_CYSF2|nr:hypothetical protein [Cystobacter fuscus]EPX59327.1 hypothetical protein D187_002817 [Cystobacter fuscus DSM 2262]
MRRLLRLDVSVEMAVHLLLLWLLCQGAIPLVFKLGFTVDGLPVHLLIWTGESLRGGLGWGIGLLVLGVAWLETRVDLRPWVKRCLRLAGPLFLASLLFSLWLMNWWIV